MSGTTRRKLKSEITRENYVDDADDGTAARTRPLSYDEIMLKRESKKKLDNFKEKALELESSRHEETVRNSDHHRRDANSISMKSSRDYAREAGSRKKEEKTARVEDTHGKRKIKGSRDVENRSTDKHEKGKKNSAELLKNDSRGHGRNKLDEHSRDDPKHGHEKRHHRDSVVHDRHIERSKAPERESKRKDRGGNDEKYSTRDPVKKHDSGRRHTEISERKEPSYSHHDQTKSKRRRSQSLERVADKGRSRSSSPKTQKNLSSHGHDHDDPSSHPQRDRSRYHSDFDRKKMSSNGSGTHHRRHGGSSSGLGGYSPRKRKTEAAVKTPSPPVRSPERKSAGWDLPPSGGDGNLSGSVASAPQLLPQTVSSKMIELAGAVSVASNMGKSLPAMLSNNLSAFKETSIDSIQLTQATRPMRRLYIDNIPGSTSEKDITEYFNNFLLSFGANHIRGTRPCISCMIHKEKGQALVEFLTPEDASAALSFDGKSLFGSIVKVRRPKDFIEAALEMIACSSTFILNQILSGLWCMIVKSGAVPCGFDMSFSGPSEKSKARADVISDIVKDSPHKLMSGVANLLEQHSVYLLIVLMHVKFMPMQIFIGGIAEGISSEMIMEIVSAFGPLKAFHYKVNEDLNQPCAFFEYADQSITLKACAGLNGMRLGGRVLTVAQAVPHTSSEVVCLFTDEIDALQEDSGRMPFYGIPDHVKPLLESPTQVLKLNNVLDQRTIELLSQTDLEEIMEDVRLECSRFGSVVSINVVKTGNIQTAISETKEVTNDTMLKSGEEQDPEIHHLDLKSMEGYLNHDRAESGVEQSSKIEADRVKEGGCHDSCPATATIDVEAAGTSSAENIKESDKIVPKNCDDGTANHPEEVATTDSSTVEVLEDKRTEDSGEEGEEGHAKESDLGPSEKMDTDKSGNGEIPSVEEEFEKTHHKLRKEVPVASESATPNLGATENVVKNENVWDTGTVFEVGCVLVEFRRPEASCMAAHCLQGRVFDDRVVTVEYVPLDAYRARFPK
ncbi:hypothetical protein Cgig2_020433 [Carnegiea gigantea]|uniref:RRM domain-containing protein n=1 Tax=Carnegiea gigantea TaxID=171969 RepID=A0A9Q1JYT9_9CARY|nr:hypothetical protein Cgig2_020433 [Carnegiea gigantea]